MKKSPQPGISEVKLTFHSLAMFTRVNHDLGARIKAATEATIKVIDDTAQAKSIPVVKVYATRVANGFSNGNGYSHNSGMFAHIQGDDGF